MAEDILVTAQAAGPSTTPPVVPPTPRRLLAWLVPAFTAAGILAILCGTMWLGPGPMWARVVLTLIGATLLYRAFDAVLKLVTPGSVPTLFWAATGWLTLVVSAAILAPILPLGESSNTAKTLEAPTYARPDLFSHHPLGTNNFGLDELSRVIYGARSSLTVSVSAVIIGIAVGGLIGMIAAYSTGLVDGLVRLLTNTLYAFPPLIILLALSSVLTPSLRNISLALAVLSVPTNVRLARAHSLALIQQDFVLIARAMGATTRRIVFRELLPSVLTSLLSYATILTAILIVAEAALSFLGLGIQQPNPSWGNMIAEGQNGVVETTPHIVLVPGVFLFLTVFSLNVVGDRLRQRSQSMMRQG